MSKKEKIPSNFKGCIMIMSASDRNWYEEGDVIELIDIDWSKFNDKEIKEYIKTTDPLGSDVWDNPIFDIRFVKDRTVNELKVMLEPLIDENKKTVQGVKRRYNFKLSDGKFNDDQDRYKDELESTDVNGTITERYLDGSKQVQKRDRIV